MANSKKIKVKHKISNCPGFRREAYTCPQNGQFGLHDGCGGHICDRCESCVSIENYGDRIEIGCVYPYTAEEYDKQQKQSDNEYEQLTFSFS